MSAPEASSAVPCEYDAQRGGFPLAVLEHQPPAELCCVACQRIARDAVTARKGPCLGLYAHTSPTAHTLIRTHPTARQYVITPTPLPPPVTGAAGQLCCDSCATAALPKPRRCPRCGGPCEGEGAASAAARVVIAAMGARCPARCGWAGPLRALDAHWAQCGREGVACAVAGCGATVARGEMGTHIAGALAQRLCALAKVGQPLSRAVRRGCLAAACALPSRPVVLAMAGARCRHACSHADGGRASPH